jgi:hypothetical protein
MEHIRRRLGQHRSPGQMASGHSFPLLDSGILACGKPNPPRVGLGLILIKCGQNQIRPPLISN